MSEKKDIQPATAFFPMFEKYDMSVVKIEDLGLQRYINLENKDFFLAHLMQIKCSGKQTFQLLNV